ncbi:MAG: chromosomal replication initiator protein DnaA [Anaerolineales bacterium]|nr:chromosomal replication initiator protein DnaA [Anaerolineales bacterium]
MNANEIWHATLGELQLQMTKATFDTWVRPTHAIAYRDGEMTVGVHSPYAKEWLENRLHTTIARTVTGIVGRSVQVQYIVKDKISARALRALPQMVSAETMRAADPEPSFDSADEEQFVPPKPRGEDMRQRTPAPLNPKYTFETFIVGNSNRLAHAATLAVAEHPGESYNPLFLYGGTGLGKTHLLHALGQHPNVHGRRVLYVSSETFTNDLINAIRNQTTPEFRRVYREIDVLLIDDIQFIGGKESTQEEFFHTFNHLYSANKQIVISSDRHPRGIPTLEERVRSRFEGGMITDIQPPDLEMRIAILRTKADALGVAVPSEVLDFIAHKVQSNIRELEGALTRILGYARLMNASLSTDLATNVLQDIVRQQPLTIQQVLAVVADYYHVELADLTGRSRNKDIVLPRQMAMYILREETGTSLPQIGDMIGGRDHTTVIYAHDKMAEEIETNDQRRRELLAIRERLYKQLSTEAKLAQSP